MLVFPDAKYSGSGTPEVPLDVADDFPFRVQVCARLGHLESAVSAHVWVESNPGSTLAPNVTGAVTDTSITLADLDGTGDLNPADAGDLLPKTPDTLAGCPRLGAAGDGDYYTGITTLNAPDVGLTTVGVDVAGMGTPAQVQIGPSDLSDPLLALQYRRLPNWSTDIPRFAVCVSTASAKGTIDLWSDDSTAIASAGTPLSGTLVSGPCELTSETYDGGVLGTLDVGEDNVSHAVFGFAARPPFTLFAALHGHPIDDLGSAWVTKSIEVAPQVVALSRPYFQEVDEPLDGGDADRLDFDTGPLPGETIYEVTTRATDENGTPIEGLSVGFSGSSGATFSPTSSLTDDMGWAHTLVTMDKGKQALVVVAGGDAFNAVVSPTLPGPSPSLITLNLSVTSGGPAPPDLGAQPGGGELVYQVVATLMSDTSKDVSGQTVTFAVLSPEGASAATLYPTTAMTDDEGNAYSLIAIDPSQQVIVTAQVDGLIQFGVVTQ